MRTWMFCVACSISQVFKHLHLLNISSSYFVSNAFFSGLTNIPSALLIFFEKDDTSTITVKQSFKTKLRSYYHVVISILITDKALVSTSDKSDSQYMEIFREFRTSLKAPYLVSCWSNLRLFFCHVLNVGWDHITLHIPFYYYRWSDIFFSRNSDGIVSITNAFEFMVFFVRAEFGNPRPPSEPRKFSSGLLTLGRDLINL